jgi:biopolymer transport protein ExbD
MKIERKVKAKAGIPQQSLSDIVFMLLLFFMVSTVFRKYSGLNVDLPRAQRIKKLEAKKNVVNIWASAEGELTIDDFRLTAESHESKMRLVQEKMREKIAENAKITTSMKIDRTADMGFVSDIQQRLRAANALKVNYCAKYGD